MRLSSNELFKAVRFALYAGASAVVGYAAPALAQDAQDQSNQQLETITVTGSNIRRVDIETSNPVITIDRAAIQKTGKLTLGDLVQQLPAVTGPNINPQVNNSGGTGASSIGLRGLGSARTLVLINGHRYLSGDPNAIPANMVERIEVLTDGASSVYGSDAVAGVVNFILRSDYQGAEFSTNYGISDKDDGQSKGYQFTFGQSSDKGSIMAGISYNKIDQVLAGHRDFSKNSVSLYGNTASAPSATSAVRLHRRSATCRRLTRSVTSIRAHSWRAIRVQAASTSRRTTTATSTTAQRRTPSDKYNFATVNLIMTPQERTGLFLNGNYKLTDNVEAYLSVMHNKTSSAFQLAPDPLTTGGGLVISADSYYNPFGIEYRKGQGNFGTRLVTVGNRRGAFGNNTDQVSTGFKGSFGVWNDQQWNWEVGMDYGHVSDLDRDHRSSEPDQAESGNGSLVPRRRWHCPLRHGRRADQRLHADQHLQPQRSEHDHGPASVAVPASNRFFTQEKVWRGDINGGLFELPAGTMQLAVGASYRKEYTHSIVDTSLQINPATGICVLGSQCGSSLQGGYNVKEVYAELFVPILKDIPFVHALNLTIGDRYSKYNNFGNTNNSKIALEWRPIEDLLLRGTVSEVFRAPTVANLFGGAASDAPKLSNDPCDHYTGNPPNPACANVPTDGSFVNSDVASGLQSSGIASGSQVRRLPARTGVRQVVRLGHRL